MRKMLLKLERKFSKLLPREQRIFPFFLIVCIFIVFQFLLLTPVLKKKTRLKIDSDSLKNEVFSLKQKLKGMDTVSNALDKIRIEVANETEIFNKLTHKIPSKDQLASILSYLASAEKIKFMVKEMDEKSYIENSRYTVIPFSITIEGDYFDVLSFLVSMEDEKNRLLKVENIRFSQENIESSDVTAYFVVHAYKIRSMDYLMELSKKEAIAKEKEKENENNIN